jgi:hypothetical protein
LIKDLEQEIALVWASDQAKRAASASRQAGAAATDAERQKIVALSEALYQEQEARQRSEDQMMLYRDLTRAGLDDLFGALEQGKNFWEALGDVGVNSLKRIADTLLDDVLTSIFKVNSATSGSGGGGFLSSLLGGFGGLFGGGSGAFPSAPGGLYAKGGTFTNGISGYSNQIVSSPTTFAFAKGTGLMGEAGPEAIMPLKKDASGRLGVAVNGGNAATQNSQPVSISMPINIDATGADAAGLVRVEKQLAKLKETLPETIFKTVKSAQEGRRL